MLTDEMKEIAELARKQREGGFTTESDALFALILIERLASAMAAVIAYKPENPDG